MLLQTPRTSSKELAKQSKSSWERAWKTWKTPREIREHNENVLFSTAPHTLGPVQPELPEIDFNLDLESIVNLDEFEVYITIQNSNNPITNKTIRDVDRSNLLVENQLDPRLYKSHTTHNKVLCTLDPIYQYSSNFILDSRATKHIISDRSYFHTFQNCNMRVNWGQAKSMQIQGVQSVNIMFLDTKMRTVLHNWLFMPPLGINLISQSCLSENIHTILTSNTISMITKLSS